MPRYTMHDWSRDPQLKQVLDSDNDLDQLETRALRAYHEGDLNQPVLFDHKRNCVVHYVLTCAEGGINGCEDLVFMGPVAAHHTLYELRRQGRFDQTLDVKVARGAPCAPPSIGYVVAGRRVVPIPLAEGYAMHLLFDAPGYRSPTPMPMLTEWADTCGMQ